MTWNVGGAVLDFTCLASKPMPLGPAREDDRNLSSLFVSTPFNNEKSFFSSSLVRASKLMTSGIPPVKSTPASTARPPSRSCIKMPFCLFWNSPCTSHRALHMPSPRADPRTRSFHEIEGRSVFHFLSAVSRPQQPPPRY